MEFELMNNKRNKPKLSQRIFINLLISSILSIGLLGFFWIQSEYSDVPDRIKFDAGEIPQLI